MAFAEFPFRVQTTQAEFILMILLYGCAHAVRRVGPGNLPACEVRV